MPNLSYGPEVDVGERAKNLAEVLFSARAAWNIEGHRLYNCDVCWTCEYFDVLSKNCSQTVITKHNSDRCKDYTWYRCPFWNGRNER